MNCASCHMLWPLISTSEVLSLLCSQVEKGSSAIIYLTETEKFGRSTASSQVMRASLKGARTVWLNHCSPWPDIMCAVSAAAGWLPRHTRDSLECWQLGTGKGGKHFQMKMYKKCFIPQRTFYSSESSLGVLQLAPSIDHQISAMFSILERYPEIFN